MCGKWEKYKIYFPNNREGRVVLCKNWTVFRISIIHKHELKNENKKLNGLMKENKN